MQPDPRDRSIWWAGCGARQHDPHALGHRIDVCVASAHMRMHRRATRGVCKSGIAETPEVRSNQYLWWQDTSVRLGRCAAIHAAAGAVAERPARMQVHAARVARAKKGNGVEPPTAARETCSL